MKSTSSMYWVNPHIAGLDAYVPGSQVEAAGWIKLNTNENPYPPSPRVIEAIKGEFDRLHLYPNPLSSGLRSTLANQYKVKKEQVIAGNGSDDLLNLLMRTFSDGKHSAGAMNPSYSLYPVLAGANGTPWVNVEFEEPFRLPIQSIIDSQTNLFFLTCPHAPSGVCYSLEVIAELADRFDGLLVVDEAYADFAGSSASELVVAHDNIFVTRTFSKAFGLAGLRVGYGIGPEKIIQWLDAVRDSYNLDRVGQAAAIAVLTDWDYYQALIEKISTTRDFYRNEFESLGWFVYPSQSNFLLVEPKTLGGKSGPEVAESLFSYLLERKILIRYFPKHALTRNFLRISVGDENQMMSLWDCTKEWLTKE